MAGSWMIYGANGYTGILITELAVSRGMKPIVAGRNSKLITKIAKKHSLDSKVFSLESIEFLKKQLNNIDIFLNCAGPFSKTANIAMKACIESNTHYLDITGEIDIYEIAHTLNERAKQSGVVLCPGVGFDVIPTDCLSFVLKEKLPTASELSLAFSPKGGSLSPGTLKTSVESLGNGGRVRADGKIIKVPIGHKSRKIDFGNGPRSTASISWGDISTAFYTSGIGNICVFYPFSSKSLKRLRLSQKFLFLLDNIFIQKVIKSIISTFVKGPNNLKREKSKIVVWGEVKDKNNKSVKGMFSIGNGYDVTASGAIEAVVHLLNNTEDSGFYTPALLLGTSILKKLPGFSGIKFET